MSRHNLLNKKIKKQILSINDLFENIFNKLKYFKSNYKKILLNKNNRVFLFVGILVILTLSYLSLPSFYNKETIRSEIKNQLLKNYNIRLKLENEINYSFFPSPHFFIRNPIIVREKKEIGKTKNLRVFIDGGNLLAINEISIRNLVFEKTDFNIYLEDFAFFESLLKTEPHDNSISFKKSNIFFKNKDDEILFINKIFNSKFYYDSKNLQNVLDLKNEVFNVPFNITLRNDKFNKEFLTKFDSNKIRLNIENIIDYENKSKKGIMDILFINKSTSLEYELDQNSLNFFSFNNKNSYKGTIDFKPFYFAAELNYEGLSTKNLFDENFIFIDLINSELLNNKNFSANFDVNIKNITNVNELNDLRLKIFIEDGNINFSNSKIKWKNNLEIILDESLLVINNDGANLVGTTIFNFNDVNTFYTSFQILKKNRKKMKQMQLDYVYNFNTKSITFENPRVDGKQNQKLDEFLNIFNSEQDRIFNKITFKNFMNNFFNAYAG
ncbi:hypothetical protein OA095_04910 [Candidatus Pelagibacter sp.]|nr:hypothetical protein [Candidatus Pelagibacter sp.]